MTQRELDRAVARRTGEPVRTIAARGFGILVLTAHGVPAAGSTAPGHRDHERAVERAFGPSRAR